MKKTIAIAILLALILTICSCGCSSASHYKYADNYTPVFHDDFINDEFWASVPDYSSEADVGDLLGLIERIFQKHFGELNMDWENFSTVTTALQVKPSANDAKTVSSSVMAGIFYSIAIYNRETKEVFLFPDYFDSEPGKQLQALTHELVHAGFNTKKNSQIEEGLAEFYASRFLDKVGYPMKETIYPNEMTVATWLVLLFGEEKVVDAVRSETVDSLIDSVTKPGMGKKVEGALQAIFWGQDRNKAVNVIYDVLCHATIGAGKKSEDVDYLLQYVKELSTYNGTEFDISYCRRILRG